MYGRSQLLDSLHLGKSQGPGHLQPHPTDLHSREKGKPLHGISEPVLNGQCAGCPWDRVRRRVCSLLGCTPVCGGGLSAASVLERTGSLQSAGGAGALSPGSDSCPWVRTELTEIAHPVFKGTAQKSNISRVSRPQKGKQVELWAHNLQTDPGS